MNKWYQSEWVLWSLTPITVPVILCLLVLMVLCAPRTLKALCDY